MKLHIKISKVAKLSLFPTLAYRECIKIHECNEIFFLFCFLEWAGVKATLDASFSSFSRFKDLASCALLLTTLGLVWHALLSCSTREIHLHIAKLRHHHPPHHPPILKLHQQNTLRPSYCISPFFPQFNCKKYCSVWMEGE